MVLPYIDMNQPCHVFPILIPPPASLSIPSHRVFPVHQPRALVSCIQPGLVICFTLVSILVSMLFSRNIPPSPSPTVLQFQSSDLSKCMSGWHWRTNIRGMAKMKAILFLKDFRIVFKHWPILGFPCGLAGKESACNAGDLGSISGLGRSRGEGKGYPLQCSDLENSMDCIVHGAHRELDMTEQLSLSHCSEVDQILEGC